MHVDPSSLRIAFTPYDKPVVAGWYRGKPIYHDGALTATWNSPEGPFSQVRSVRTEIGPEDIEELRPRLAQDLADAYDEARAKP